MLELHAELININPVMEGRIGGEEVNSEMEGVIEGEVDHGKWMRRQRRWTDNFLRQIGRYYRNV